MAHGFPFLQRQHKPVVRIMVQRSEKKLIRKIAVIMTQEWSHLCSHDEYDGVIFFSFEAEPILKHGFIMMMI